MSNGNARRWFGIVLLPVEYLKAPRFDIESYLLDLGPDDARPDGFIERLHVRPTESDGILSICCIGREGV